MPDVTVFVPKPFPYTFPFTFGAVDKAAQAAAHEPVLPIEYRYTLPDFFFVQEPSTWLGFIEVLQGMEELLMPIWPSEAIHAAPHLYPYIFGGTDLDQLFDKDISWWQNQPTTLMPEYTSEELYGAIHNIPYVFGGTDLRQLFDEADLTWYSQPATLMPEYHPRDLYGLFEGGISGGNWAVMQLSTPIFSPNGSGVAEPGQIDLPQSGYGRVEIVGPS